MTHLQSAFSTSLVTNNLEAYRMDKLQQSQSLSLLLDGEFANGMMGVEVLAAQKTGPAETRIFQIMSVSLSDDCLKTSKRYVQVSNVHG